MSDHDFGAAHLAIHGHPQAPVPPPDLHPHPAPAARPLQHAASNSEARKRDDVATCLVCGNSVALAPRQDDERSAEAGEVWQESDNVLLLCIEPGKWWGDFRGDRVPWNAPTIARPLARLLDADGNLAALGDPR